MNLNKLLNPESIVIVGATTKEGMGGRATLNIIRSVINKRVYYLNPKRDEINGRKCYHSLQELPEVVDCMVLCTPAKTISGYMEEAGRLGIKAAVAFASGFSEERTEQGQALSEELKNICQKYDIALCGPNCVGYVNALDHICGGPEDYGLLNMDIKSGLGAVAQSGFITSGFTYPDATNIAYIVSAGNCISVSLEEYMLHFALDDRVTCIAAYIEGIKQPDILEKALYTAAMKRKPVVVLKAGMTEKGSFAAKSHTGSLAGDYKTYEAVFRKFGAIITKSLQEFTSTAKMFAVLNGNYPSKTGIGAINFSGGENTLCADSAERFGLELPEFESKTIARISAIIPSFSTAANPLDATTSMFGEREKVRELFMAVSEDKQVGLITLGNDLPAFSEPKDITCSEVMAELSREGKLIPAVVIPSFERTRNDQIRLAFENAGIPVLSTGNLAFEAIRHLMDFVTFRPVPEELKLARPQNSLRKEKISLSESESKAELAAYGVRVPGQKLITDCKELKSGLHDMDWPVVMKIDSPDILHKTEAGGVKLNIASFEEAQDAFNEIMESCRKYRPDARMNGVMIQEMVPQGLEFIIGVKNDSAFGPVLMVGLGGIFVEVFKDVMLFPCPITKEKALFMLKQLKGYVLLEGYRGKSKHDIDALTDLMVAVSDYAVKNRDNLVELDLNPVFVYEEKDGICAADALIVKYIS